MVVVVVTTWGDGDEDGRGGVAANDNDGLADTAATLHQALTPREALHVQYSLLSQNHSAKCAILAPFLQVGKLRLKKVTLPSRGTAEIKARSTLFSGAALFSCSRSLNTLAVLNRIQF